MTIREPSTGVWKIAIGYCLKCWWKLPEEFHYTVPAESVEKNLSKKHREQKPDCGGTLRYEFKVKK